MPSLGLIFPILAHYSKHIISESGKSIMKLDENLETKHQGGLLEKKGRAHRMAGYGRAPWVMLTWHVITRLSLPWLQVKRVNPACYYSNNAAKNTKDQSE